ncbi:ABC transporter permease [Bacteroidota bacterium]
MFAIILIAPVIQLIFLGYAVNMDVELVPTVVYDQDKSVASRSYLEQFESTGYFEFVDFVSNYEDLKTYIENGDATVGIVIPYNFEKQVGRTQPADIQVIFDGSDGNKASISFGYVSSITRSYIEKLYTNITNKIGLKNLSASSVQPEFRVWYNPELKTRIFMVPGIVGLLLSIITLILTSLAVVKEKEIGTLEQLIVTPIKPYQLIAGKLIPFAILGFAAITIVITAMIVIFGIYPKGSVLFLFLSAFIFILSTLGFGLFISTISKTQQQAMMLAIFGIMMPMVFLSGFAFPIENMPEIVQFLTYLVPLRYFMTIIRGVILKGIGLYELWGELIILMGMGIIVLTLSAIKFKRRLE